MEPTSLVKTTRSGVCECIHRGSVVVLQGNKLIYAIGNPYVQIPMRSTAKPLIAKSFINNEISDRFEFDASEIAIMASSHNGEEGHRNTIKGLLNKINYTVDDLKCGVHDPYFNWIVPNISELTPIYHNCSGKHAGMLAMCRALDISAANYWEISHPVQDRIYKELCETLMLRPTHIHVGIDGCGVPTYIVSLLALAEAYQTFFDDDVLKIISSSMLQHPFMVAGTDRLDTAIMSTCGYLAKSGSEGIFCLVIPHEKITVAIKIESGSDEAAESVAVEVLQQLGLLAEDHKLALEKYRAPNIMTSTGVIVGQMTPIF